MIKLIIMIIYINYSYSLNEYYVDNLNDIDFNLFESIISSNDSITDYVVYLQDKNDKNKYGFYNFVGYSDVDTKSYITYNGNSDYSYHGINIKPID